jgi:hypothetical protein
MTTYTNITKPSSTSYTNQNLVGKEQFDDVNVMYDDPVVFYDGVNQSQYTVISRPSRYGLWSSEIFPWLLVLPWQTESNTIYTNVTKPV